MSKDWFSDIVSFHKAIGQYPEPFKPQIPTQQVESLRVELVREEILELFTAQAKEDLVKVADGIVDSIVVLIGTAVAYGIDIRPIWDEVHTTNMAKLRGPMREDGKQLKPKGWKPPDIASEIERQQTIA